MIIPNIWENKEMLETTNQFSSFSTAMVKLPEGTVHSLSFGPYLYRYQLLLGGVPTPKNMIQLR